MSRLFSTLLALSLATPFAASAQAVNVMPDSSYDAIASKLLMSGYKDLRLVSAEDGLINGFDKEGSEVMIVVDPESRKVLRTINVHETDD